MQNSLTVNDAGSMLMGAGLTQINSDLNTALILLGTGVALKLLVAVLQKNGIEVSSGIQG